MRRILFATLSLLALGSGAHAADLPPAPELPPLQAEPAWTGFFAGLTVGGALGSSRNAFTIAGFGLPTFNTPDEWRGWGRRGRLQLADRPLDARARGELRGERAPRPPHGALPAASLRRACGALCADNALVRDAEAAAWLCARELAFLRDRRGSSAKSIRMRRPRPVPSPPPTIAASANRLDARRGRQVEIAQGWSAKIEYLYLDLGSRATTYLLPRRSRTPRASAPA